MATPPNAYLSNSSFNKFKGSYLNNSLDVSGGDIICRNGNLYLAPGSSIYTNSNQIFFNEPYAFTNFSQNVHIYGTQQLDYSGTTYNVGYSLVDNITRLTNISYTSGTNTTTITGNLSIPAGTVTGFVPDTGNSTIGGIKTFSSAPVMSGASISSGTIAGASLAVSYIPDTGNSTIGGIKTFSSAPVMSGASISSSTIPDSALVLGGAYVNLSTSQLINTGTKTWTAAQIFSSNVSIIGNLILNVGGSIQITNATLRFLTAITSDVQTQINACAKLTANTFTGIQTFSNNIIANSLTITPTVLGYLSGVTSSIQTQINSISTANFASLTANNTFTGSQDWSNGKFAGTLICSTTAPQFQNGCTITGNTTNSGTFVNTGLITASNDIRVNGNLIVNAGATTVLNATLNNLNYLSGLSGTLGQRSTTTFNTVVTYTSGTYSAIGSISLTAGVYSVQAQITLFGGGAYLQSQSIYGISTSNTAFSDTDEPYIPASTTTGYSCYQYTKVLAPTATTTYYLMLFPQFTGTMSSGLVPRNYMKTTRIG